jgi:hypothetical protein
MLVHNNGYAEIAATHNIGGETVVLIPGKMTQVDSYLFFPKTSRETVL